jgi:hypothetical protein
VASVNFDQIYVVYSMGKVGSTSLYESLRQQRPANAFVAHAHFLHLPRLLQRLESSQANPDLGRHVRHAFAVHRVIRENPKARIHWISLVRDPLAREISNIIQNPWLIGSGPANLSDATALETSLDRLRSGESYRFALEWFDNEFLRVTGGDVYDHEFPTDRGYNWFAHCRRESRIVLLQMERLDDIPANAWQEILGYPVHISRHHETATKEASHRDLSLRLASSFRADVGLLQKVYDSRLMQHFYSAEQLAAFRTKWQQ